MYNLMFVIGFVFGLAYIILYSKKFDIKIYKGIILLALCYAFLYFLMFLLFYISQGYYGGQNMVRVYPFVPLVIAGFAFLLNINIRRASDFFAPIPLIIFGISHIGCVWGDCCYTFIESDFGIYNKIVNKTLFPNQILEAVLAIATAVLLIVMLTKRKYDMGGKAMGYMLILYGAQRFLLEFLRDNQKIIFNISELAFWALAAIVVGVIFNIFIQDRSNKNEKSI